MNPLFTHCPGHLLTGVISIPVSNEDPIQRLQASHATLCTPLGSRELRTLIRFTGDRGVAKLSRLEDQQKPPRMMPLAAAVPGPRQNCGRG
jgi:hypothetical protein